MVVDRTDRVAAGSSTPSLPEKVRERLDALKELPSSARALRRALDLLDEPLCTNQRLESVLASDQGAVTGLLRLANSAYFGVPSEVSKASTAIRLVGHRRLRALLCHLLAGKILEILRTDAPIVDQVRRKALAAAVVCGEAGAAAGDSEQLRVAGLLHNVGELALIAEFPDDFTNGADAASVFGINCETAGAKLLRGWRMPEPIAQAALYWQRPSSSAADPAAQRTIDAVHFGGTLAEAWIEGETTATALGRCEEDVMERLGLTEARAAFLFSRIQQGVAQLEASL